MFGLKESPVGSLQLESPGETSQELSPGSLIFSNKAFITSMQRVRGLETING